MKAGTLSGPVDSTMPVTKPIAGAGQREARQADAAGAGVELPPERDHGEEEGAEGDLDHPWRQHQQGPGAERGGRHAGDRIRSEGPPIDFPPPGQDLGDVRHQRRDRHDRHRLLGAELVHQDRQQHDRRTGAEDAAHCARDEADEQHERIRHGSILRGPPRRPPARACNRRPRSVASAVRLPHAACHPHPESLMTRLLLAASIAAVMAALPLAGVAQKRRQGASRGRARQVGVDDPEEKEAAKAKAQAKWDSMTPEEQAAAKKRFNERHPGAAQRRAGAAPPPGTAPPAAPSSAPAPK
jgi:hypothetical protein